MTAKTSAEPVRKIVRVACPVDHAFRVFTEEVGSWWPVASHSVGGESSTVRFEPGPEGRLVETLDDGRERVWGWVLDWDEPHGFLISWHPGEDCARTQVNEATEVEVTFSPDGDGTRLELVHRGWERLGDRAPAAQDGYDTGWTFVLARFVAAAV